MIEYFSNKLYIYTSCFLTANFSLSGNLLIRFIDIAHIQPHKKNYTDNQTTVYTEIE